MSKLLGFAVSMIGVFWLAIAGGYAVHWWDTRPAGVPSINVPLPFGLHWRWTAPESLKARLDATLAADAQATALAHAQDLRIAALSETLSVEDENAQTKIRTVVKQEIQFVPQYITADDDRRCVIGAGFVRVFNAASRGIDLPAISKAPGGLDDSPSPFSLSDVADATVTNDGIALSNAQRLKDLQTWVAVATETNHP